MAFLVRLGLETSSGVSWAVEALQQPPRLLPALQVLAHTAMHLLQEMGGMVAAGLPLLEDLAMEDQGIQAMGGQVPENQEAEDQQVEEQAVADQVAEARADTLPRSPLRTEVVSKNITSISA